VLGGAVAAHFTFNLQNRIENLLRVQSRLELDGAVQELRLVREFYRLGFVER